MLRVICTAATSVRLIVDRLEVRIGGHVATTPVHGRGPHAVGPLAVDLGPGAGSVPAGWAVSNPG